MKTKTMTELVELYNSLSGKIPIKRFQSKSIGIERIEKLLALTKVFKKESPVIVQKQPSKDYINFIAFNQHLDNQSLSEHPKFQGICVKAGCEPTAKQASKFRNQKGLAFQYFN